MDGCGGINLFSFIGKRDTEDENMQKHTTNWKCAAASTIEDPRAEVRIEEGGPTSPSSSYQACHGVIVGSLRASMLYLVEVTGITASVSPLEKFEEKSRMRKIHIFHRCNTFVYNLCIYKLVICNKIINNFSGWAKKSNQFVFRTSQTDS